MKKNETLLKNEHGPKMDIFMFIFHHSLEKNAFSTNITQNVIQNHILFIFISIIYLMIILMLLEYDKKLYL